MVTGHAQVALEPMGGNIAKYREQVGRFALLTTPESGGGAALAMNIARPPFSDARLRQALALTFDSAEFVERAGYDDPAVVMTTIDRPHSLYASMDVRLPQRDIERAQALIGAIVAEQGGPVRFTIDTYPNEGHIREARVMKAIIEDHLVDVDVEIFIGSIAELVARRRSGEFQACNHALQWSEPALDLPSQLTSTSPMNAMGYRNEQVDKMLSMLARADNDAARVEAHHGVLQQVLKDNPLVWLSRKVAYHVVDRSVTDWNLFYSLRPRLEDVRLIEPETAAVRLGSKSGGPI
jgi:ABC-type oligopeptide transport system substrate-binding subunit